MQFFLRVLDPLGRFDRSRNLECSVKVTYNLDIHTGTYPRLILSRLLVPILYASKECGDICPAAAENGRLSILALYMFRLAG